MLRVRHIAGEPTCYYVESRTLQCVVPECSATFAMGQHKHLSAGMKCPKCGKGPLDFRWHRVDVANYFPLGECSCEHFQIRLAHDLARLSPDERTQFAENYRCSHIKAARDFSLDLTIKHHQHQSGGGRAA